MVRGEDGVQGARERGRLRLRVRSRFRIRVKARVGTSTRCASARPKQCELATVGWLPRVEARTLGKLWAACPPTE